MTKWADYLVKGVRYDRERTHIEKVQIAPDLGESIGAWEEKTRSDVLGMIDTHKSVMTVFKAEDSANFRKGATVEPIRVNGVR